MNKIIDYKHVGNSGIKNINMIYPYKNKKTFCMKAGLKQNMYF